YDLPALFVVPGIGSHISYWDDMLVPLKDLFPIYYFESREKMSSGVDKRHSFEPDRFAADIYESVNSLKIKEEKLVLFGSSVGCMSILEAYKNHPIQAHSTILNEPVMKLNLPSYGQIITKFIPEAFVNSFKPFLKWYVTRIMVKNPAKNKKLVQRYLHTIDNLEGWKLKNFACRFRKYTLRYQLKKIKINNSCSLIGSKLDALHDIEQTEEMSKALGAEYTVFEQNQKTRGSNLAQLIYDKFVEKSI
ncbi:MAG: alpha/beta hydrolase, partial [Candidatus Heimdallarchaeota archaeon]|nr:alpha/beta hydrolase [Candidatus Heimdallarchaeota archaeon]MCK5048483.1 alpha/beta hydrolase [Candidatus Heimdallarchaeota archaeon]